MRILLGAIGAAIIGLTGMSQLTAAADVDNPSTETLNQVVKEIKLPVIEQPTWLKEQIAQEKAAAAAARSSAVVNSNGQTITVTYNTDMRGAVIANFNEFKQLANQTLNDGRGWARMNVKFVEVASGGQFTLILSEASQLPTFSSGCSAQYSCRVGTSIIINQDRWQNASPAWNAAGGSLRDYRHTVINHEVGHWLGHGHPGCGGAGQPAPVMLQQSIDLQGCKFNPWPLASELYSGALGI